MVRFVYMWLTVFYQSLFWTGRDLILMQKRPPEIKLWCGLPVHARPASSSYIMMPRPQMSTPFPAPLFSSTSGAMYSGVPQNVNDLSVVW